ncbi:MAG: SH3 domain-containing protein [Lachnospiraceae bacterium]|nr:SH3 domain-containing protein [Lachnospiraceae bacterium]
MLRSSVKAGVLILAGVMLCSSMDVQASGLSSVLPNGGINIALAQGTSLESMSLNAGKTDVVLETVVSASEVDEAAAKAKAEARAAAKAKELETLRNMVIADVNRYVNIRSIPSEDGEVLGKLYDNSAGVLVSEQDGWYEITSGTVTGFVKAEYVVTGDAAVELSKEVGTRLATVQCDGLYVRKEPSTDAPILGMVAFEDELLVYEETDEWIKVDTVEGDGYVSAEYVTLHTEFVQAESREEEEARLEKERQEREKAQKAAQAAAKKKVITYVSSDGGTEMGRAVAEYALQFVGNPYKWGGTSLTKGADCSGFVMSVYENFGVSLPHSSAADRKQGYAVDGLENAQPGDLICYSGHVALYIGDGEIVHAASKKSGIKVSRADYKKILAIRRIF